MPLEKPKFTQKLGRWWRMTFKNVVLLKRIQRDEETGGYKIVIEETTRKELPIEAVKIDGTHNEFGIDEVGVEKHYNASDYGFSAIDLNLWLESNAINDALALKWDGLQGLLDKKKLSVALIVGVIAVAVVYVVMSGMS